MTNDEVVEFRCSATRRGRSCGAVVVSVVLAGGVHRVRWDRLVGPRPGRETWAAAERWAVVTGEDGPKNTREHLLSMKPEHPTGHPVDEIIAAVEQGQQYLHEDRPLDDLGSNAITPTCPKADEHKVGIVLRSELVELVEQSRGLTAKAVVVGLPIQRG